MHTVRVKFTQAPNISEVKEKFLSHFQGTLDTKAVMQFEIDGDMPSNNEDRLSSVVVKCVERDDYTEYGVTLSVSDEGIKNYKEVRPPYLLQDAEDFMSANEYLRGPEFEYKEFADVVLDTAKRAYCKTDEDITHKKIK